MLSSATKVTDPRAAKVFASSQRRRMLMLFAGRPRSIGDAAARANLDLKRLHHHVQGFVRLGLVEVRSAVRRAGRPVKLYQTKGSAFFVPDEVSAKPFGEGLMEELRETLTAAQADTGRGLLLTVGESGEPLGRYITEGGRADSFESWRVLRLSRSDAAQLEARMRALLDDYRSSGKADEQVYLVLAAAVRRADQSGPVDNP